MTNLADGAVAVVRGNLHQYGHAARAIAFKGDLFVGHAGQLAGTALDSAFDVICRHVFGLGRSHSPAQTRVLFGIATRFGRHGDFFDQASENLSTFGVECAFFMFNCRPFGMARHGATSLFSI